MGIQGLLPLLKSIQQQKHLSDLAGKTIAVDGYVWLHKGAYGCAVDLVTGKNTTKYVEYAMHRVRLMRYHGVEPYVVFDGGLLPAKQGTEVDRKRRRDESLLKAKQFEAEGRRSQAWEMYVKCVDITPKHAFQLIKALRAEGVSYVVAPYEADAQLAYLEQAGIVNGILTEDSDLLVFGCQNVYFKLDATAYTLTHISRSDFASNKDLNLTLWTDKEFRHMAMLSGCDYLAGLKGVGIKTAHKLLRKHKTVERTLKFIAIDNGNVKVPKGYLEDFERAELAFVWQRVYCPVKKRLVHLNGEPEGEWTEEKDQYVGRHIEDELAVQIALGDACPLTHEPMPDINPSYQPRSTKSSNPSSETTIPAVQPAKKTAGPMDRFLSAAKPKAACKVLSPKKSTSNLPAEVDSRIEPKRPTVMTGAGTKGSGARTLSGETERLQATMKRQKDKEEEKEALNSAAAGTTSRYFLPKPVVQKTTMVAQETVQEVVDLYDEEEGERSSEQTAGTLVVQIDGEEVFELEIGLEDSVEQEEGYRSLSTSEVNVSSQGDTDEEVPSPETVRVIKKQETSEVWADVDVVSSPIAARKRQSVTELTIKNAADGTTETAKEVTRLVSMTPSPAKPTESQVETQEETQEAPPGDLSTFFASFESGTSGAASSRGTNSRLSSFESAQSRKMTSSGAIVVSPSSDGPPASDFEAVAESDHEGKSLEEENEEEEETLLLKQKSRLDTIAAGWRNRFALGGQREGRTTSRLIRRETSLSPIAQRRKSDGPLQPLVLNESKSVKSSKPLARPRKSDPSVGRPRTYHEASRRTSDVERTLLHDASIEMEEEYGREKKRRRVSTHLDSLATTGMGPSGTSKTSAATSTIVSASFSTGFSTSVGDPADSFVELLDEEALARSKKRLQAFSFLR